jgi:hypothetical protein
VIASVPAGTLLPGLIVGVVIGLLCLRSTDNFKAQFNGNTPWGLPSWGWFLLGFFLGVIGGILYLIARATTKSKLMRNAYSPPPAYPPPPVSEQGWGRQTETPSSPPPTTGSSQPSPPPMPPPMPPPSPASPSEQPPPSGS